jgi:hypothetical protein
MTWGRRVADNGWHLDPPPGWSLDPTPQEKDNWADPLRRKRTPLGTAIAGGAPEEPQVDSRQDRLKSANDRPPPPPIKEEPDQSIPSYLAHGLESGGYAVAGMAGEAAESFNPVSAARNAWLTLKDAAHQLLSGGDTSSYLRTQAEKDASTPFTRFAEQMQRDSQELANTPDGAKYNELRYATTDPAKSALLSPIRMVHDALQSLPSTAAMAATVYLTRGAAVKAYSEAITAGFSKAEANAIAVKAAGKIATLAGAFGEGTVGGLQQETQQRTSVLDDNKEPASPIYQAMIKAGVSKEDAKQYIATESGTEAGAAAGAVDAATNVLEGPILGRIISEGGKFVPRVAKGVAAEGIQEGVQGAGEQVGQNLAQQRYADPKQALADGVAENVLASFAVGGLTGGAFAGVGGHNIHGHEDSAIGASLVTPGGSGFTAPDRPHPAGQGRDCQEPRGRRPQWNPRRSRCAGGRHEGFRRSGTDGAWRRNGARLLHGWRSGRAGARNPRRHGRRLDL